MPDRLDAHIHLFQYGYGGNNPRLAEVDQYAELARRHNIKTALVVGYEGQPWAKGNNAYLARLMRTHDWIKATSYIPGCHVLSPGRLNALARRGFVGISLYIFDPDGLTSLVTTPPDVWAWLSEHRWLVSANAREAAWDHWHSILQRHRGLRLLISHMGLPPARAKPPIPRIAEKNLTLVNKLAQFKNVYVKLSGFYALTKPPHDYPHRAAWPYAQSLLKHFGPHRLLWGSDFTPALASVSFPQTLDVLGHIPRLSQIDRRRIEGENLRRLLEAVRP